MAITVEEIKYVPDPMAPGGKVKATFKVKSDEEVESVKLYTPDYRTLEAKASGEGEYSLETDVPHDAPAGTYDVTLIVTDKKGSVARKYGQIRIG